MLILSVYSEGRGAAAEVDAWLNEGSTRLPFDGGIKKRTFIHPTSNVTNQIVTVEA